MINLEQIDKSNISQLSDKSVYRLIQLLMDEKLSRALNSGDPDVIIQEAMQEMFTRNGEPKAPRIVAPGIVAMASVVQKNGANRHTCRLNTVKLPDDSPEIWSWEDAGSSHIFSESEEVGTLRRSIALHHAVDGLVIIQHNMKWRQDRHTRDSCRAWQIMDQSDDDSNESPDPEVILVNWTPGHLPPPHGETDTRSHSSRMS